MKWFLYFYTNTNTRILRKIQTKGLINATFLFRFCGLNIICNVHFWTSVTSKHTLWLPPDTQLALMSHTPL